MKILIKISPILHNPLASFVKLLKVNEITFLSNVKMAGEEHASSQDVSFIWIFLNYIFHKTNI